MINVTIDPRGLMQVKLPKADSGNIFNTEASTLSELDKAHPFVLASEKEGRDRLEAALAVQAYEFEPGVKAIIQEAIEEGRDMATPITTVTDFERSAYSDEFKTLMCRESKHGYIKGKRYRITSYTYSYVDVFKRNKTHFGSKFFAKEHDCRLSGKDRALRVWKDQNQTDYMDFLERPRKANVKHLAGEELWNVFDKPNIKTVAERYPARMKRNKSTLELLEAMGGFEYYEGQFDYLARIGCKSHGYVVAEPGCGKTNFCLSLIGMKGARRALIIAPQGTVRGEKKQSGILSASQWGEEIKKFAPCMDVYELFSMDDYDKILKDNKGKMPAGIFLTYYQALFYNKSVERCPKTWNDGVLVEKMLDRPSNLKTVSMCESVGVEKNGIRCIAKPSMATQIGHLFDMVCFDECQAAQNNKSLLTEQLLRLQPKYRFAFSATPIPNDVSNLFSVMGWLCVPEWYKGHRCNAAFPFAREDVKRFQREFMSIEEDITAMSMGQKKVRTISPIISSATHLVKILKSTMSFISKKDCNPEYRKPVITNVRVDMGRQQAVLYGHYMDRTNVLGATQGTKATNQVTTLRSVCAEPKSSIYNISPAPVVASPFNPKLVSMLEIVRDKLNIGEQVVIISSRTSTSTMLQKLLAECGVECARIDGTTTSRHSKESNKFKQRKVGVMLMGIKCAAAYSFDQCRNLIVSSIEWSNGVFTQALGRVDRINSPLPPNIYVILYKNSIEEVMYDMMTIRNDAANLCIKGERPQPSAHPVDMDEILAESIIQWSDKTKVHDETLYEQQWIQLREEIKNARQQSYHPAPKHGNVSVAVAQTV